jgi:hypothetical protein
MLTERHNLFEVARFSLRAPKVAQKQQPWALSLNLFEVGLVSRLSPRFFTRIPAYSRLARKKLSLAEPEPTFTRPANGPHPATAKQTRFR